MPKKDQEPGLPTRPLFERQLRGYRRDAVDEFLDQVTKQVESVQVELRQLKVQRATLEEEKRELESRLVAAESEVRHDEAEETRMSEEAGRLQAECERLQAENARLMDEAGSGQEILRAAQRTAEQMRAEARVESEAMVREAEERVARLYDEMKVRLQELRFEHDQAKKEFDEFLSQARQLSHTFIRKIDERRDTL
ncbi:MAG: DivIVA domain-containing protein [Armatimonadetes bacterium]|nr:DivIVA domain-containing protein [Armatimonadota bacterium]